ncbi:MAG: glucose-6-phosphate isomerase [Gammaproteobacteria bacterium]|nr:glucose-6-phosphate isomerase [Gammaproteobacteria bacterium]
MTTITNSKQWHDLQAHQKQIAKLRMQDLFDENPSRFSQFSQQLENILFDYSKNLITSETIALLCDFAKKNNLNSKIEALFRGDAINITENRPALHTALRNPASTLTVNNKNIMTDIHSSLNKMFEFSDKVRTKVWLGATGKPITDIVNIGIGGSHLGPLLTTHALKDFSLTDLRCHFVSNIDLVHLHDVLEKINAETTLFIISSKSFSTIETLTNANTIKEWLQNQLGNASFATHFVAVTAAPKKALAFGIPEAQIFPLWEWVGGRYSIWSAVALPLILYIGKDNFLDFLKGANAIDVHFQQAEFSKNIPVLMALIGIWYVNFFDVTKHVILPYAHTLNYFPLYVQQADMESNGKSISLTGETVDYATGPAVWGEQGCNGQHAFFQSLHQGYTFIPADFILVADQHSAHQNILVGSGLSQAQALMQGKSFTKIVNELITSGSSEADAKKLALHKVIPGNRPSNTLFLQSMTPYNLGALIALYEHKIFVQSVLWNINSFDQWGVELGKELLPVILSHLQNDTSTTLDSSTQGLINFYKSHG